jgi:hypothetical protein
MLEPVIVTHTYDEHSICIRYPEEYACIGVHLSSRTLQLRIDGKPGSACLFIFLTILPERQSPEEMWNELCEYFWFIRERQFSARMISTIITSMQQIANSQYFAEIANGNEMMRAIHDIFVDRKTVLQYINGSLS